jgi:ubiquitin-protein ligase
MILCFSIFLVDYPFKPPCIKLITPIERHSVDKSGHLKIPQINIEYWRPVMKTVNVLESFQYIFSATTEERLKSDLQDLRNEALVNNTIRNILVNEENLFEWKYSIFPTDVPFNVASFGISIKFPRIFL